MKKVLLCSIIIILVLYMLGFTSTTKPINKIKPGEFLTESTSPNGEYTVKAYLNNDGATVDYAVLCTVTDNATHKTRNVFWEYHCDNVEFSWNDADTLSIKAFRMSSRKNHVTLNVKTDYYDWRQ